MKKRTIGALVILGTGVALLAGCPSNHYGPSYPYNSPTNTFTSTPTQPGTTTPTNSPTNSPTATITNTVTVTPTATITATPTNTGTATPSGTPTNTTTITPTATITNTPTVTPTGTPSPTPTATVLPPVSGGGGTVAATVNATYPTFSPPNPTITAGQAVIFNFAGHTVYMGDGVGGCSLNYTSSPITLTFPSKGSFYFHCNIGGHSSCAGSGTCPNNGSCTGMVGIVTVN